MKKILLIALLSILTTAVISILGYYIWFRFNHEPEHIPYDVSLEHQNNTYRAQLFKKLKYKTYSPILKYNKDNYKVALLKFEITGTNNKEFDEWKEWVTEGKRLVVTFSYPSDREYFFNMLAQSSYAVVPIEGAGETLLDDVDSLMLKTAPSLNHELTAKLTKKAKALAKREEDIYIAKEMHNGGEIIYIADYTIFGDKSIFLANNGIFLNNLFWDYHKNRIILETIKSDKKDSPPEPKPLPFIFRSSFPFILGQLFILAIIFFLAYFKRFGRAVNREKYKKRSISGHLEAVGYFYQKCKNPDHMTAILDSYFIERLQKLIKVRSSEEQSVAAELKRRYNLQGEEKRILVFRDSENIIAVQRERELFIKKLRKGNYGK